MQCLCFDKVVGGNTKIEEQSQGQKRAEQIKMADYCFIGFTRYSLLFRRNCAENGCTICDCVVITINLTLMRIFVNKTCCLLMCILYSLLQYSNSLLTCFAVVASLFGDVVFCANGEMKHKMDRVEIKAKFAFSCIVIYECSYNKTR